MYLKSWNFDVDGFANPVEALGYFQNNPSFFSLALTDVRMPHMSWLELAQHILWIRRHESHAHDCLRDRFIRLKE